MSDNAGGPFITADRVRGPGAGVPQGHSRKTRRQ